MVLERGFATAAICLGQRFGAPKMAAWPHLIPRLAHPTYHRSIDENVYDGNPSRVFRIHLRARASSVVLLKGNINIDLGEVTVAKDSDLFFGKNARSFGR